MRHPKRHARTAWAKAHALAANLVRLHNPAVKRRQKTLLCRQWLLALRSGS